ncbi:MAG: hypothetical protein BWK78_02935 [Thiotrichaceae bacterium IS1]|nr:MAG: hypothetical protein BWK78_02935 [Thiotrichaceae bacterium IS1]
MSSTPIYEKDFYGWVTHHIELLKQRKFDEVDLDILIEELESMSVQDKNTLASRFIILIAHLLKWQYQFNQLNERWNNFTGASWQGSIREQRIKIEFQLENSPSLKNYLNEAVAKAYPKAVALAAKETGISKTIFPNECPYSLEQLLNDNFYPSSEPA